MREFKFRGWSNHSKTMKYFDRPEDMRSLVVMQSTGMRDKNGKEIYEGDVAKVVSFSIGIPYYTDSPHCVIKYQKEDMAFCPTLKQDNYFLTENLEWEDGIPDIEVIGNIFENPEILKEKWGMSKEDIVEKLYTEEV